jgi:hypothetical protein
MPLSILKVVQFNREARLKGSNQFLKLVPKLHAIMACEEAGNFDLAQRVVRDEIPPHYITEEGSLDKAAILSNDPSVIPNSHPMLQLFRKICSEVLQPDGQIIKQYGALEETLIQQSREISLFRREIFDMKNRLGPFVGIEPKEKLPLDSDRERSRLPSIAKEINKEMLKLDVQAVTKSTELRRKNRQEAKLVEAPKPQAEVVNLLDLIRQGK